MLIILPKMGNKPPRRRKKPQRPAYVYTLNLSNGRKYVGMTNNPSRRFGQHWRGAGAKWTQKYRPVSVHSIKKYKSRKGAERGERGQYNRMKRKHGHMVRGANHCSSYEKRCYNCGALGHYANRCRRKRRR